MKLVVEELKSAPGQRRTFEFKETLSGLSTNKPVVGELTVSANLSGLKISGLVNTLLKLECDRCLRPYFLSLVVDIDEKLVPSEYVNQYGNQKELQRDDFVEAIPASGVVDISDIVYQAVTLATPSYCRCGPECPGAPVFSDRAEGGNASGKPDTDGSDLNAGKSGGKLVQSPLADPRWKNLKTLFPKNDSQ